MYRSVRKPRGVSAATSKSLTCGFKKAPLGCQSTFDQLESPVEVSQVTVGSPQVFRICSRQFCNASFVDVTCLPLA